MGGAGGGGEGANVEGVGSETGKQTGTGVGYGMIGSPAGAYVIKGDKVQWLPAIDVNRLMLGFQVALVVFFLVVRSVASRARSRPDSKSSRGGSGRRPRTGQPAAVARDVPLRAAKRRVTSDQVADRDRDGDVLGARLNGRRN